MGKITADYAVFLSKDFFNKATSLSSTSESVFFASDSNNKIITFSITPLFPRNEKAIVLTTLAITIGIIISFFYIVHAIFLTDLNDLSVP
tara:strand:- start:131 stop:400 length:270 start_codon:yes stop_codon:yes gene_type:complete